MLKSIIDQKAPALPRFSSPVCIFGSTALRANHFLHSRVVWLWLRKAGDGDRLVLSTGTVGLWHMSLENG